MTATIDRERFGPWALVTGASSGIGKEFARQIAASGINIVLVARREDLLKEVGVEFSKRFGVEHRVIVLDVSREDFIGRLASATDDLDIGRFRGSEPLCRDHAFPWPDHDPYAGQRPRHRGNLLHATSPHRRR